MNDLIQNFINNIISGSYPTSIKLILLLLTIAFAAWFMLWVLIFKSYLNYSNEVNRLMRSKFSGKSGRSGRSGKSDISRSMGSSVYSRMSDRTELNIDLNTPSYRLNSNNSYSSSTKDSTSSWAKSQASKYLPTKDKLFWLGIYQMIFVSFFIYSVMYALPNSIILSLFDNGLIINTYNVSGYIINTYNSIHGYMGIIKLAAILCPALLILLVSPFLLMSKSSR